MIHNNRKLRHERKYIISYGFYEVLRSRLKSVMKPDENSINGGYRITSLYFDDMYRSSYNDKLAGIETRRKYRIRAYNLDKGFIRFEAKHKNLEYVSKKYSQLSEDEYYKFISGDYSFYNVEKHAETALEDFIISNKIAIQKPSVLVDYFREAYIEQAGNVRITFDMKLSTSYNLLDMFSEDIIFTEVIPNEIILEVKYDEFIPSYVEAVLSGIPYTQQSVSKFSLCTDKLVERNFRAII